MFQDPLRNTSSGAYYIILLSFGVGSALPSSSAGLAGIYKLQIHATDGAYAKIIIFFVLL